MKENLTPNVLYSTTDDDAIVIVAKEVEDHWVSRNIYPVSNKHIQTMLKKKFMEYKTLKNTGVAKRKQPSYARNCEKLNVYVREII